MQVAYLEHKAERHDECSTATAAQQQQQQQHSSGGNVGGPEEAPLLTPAMLPFLVCITKFHGAVSKPWSCECTKKG